MLTAFVSHSDCSRHDTGWSHPDHQGRLPAVVRAVYRDMLTLHGKLLDVEAVPATEAQLRLVHTEAHVAYVREAAARAAEGGSPVVLPEGPVVSGASWEAAAAAAGCALTGVDAVMRGEARNAFCCARPPGLAATAAAPAGHSLFNNVAVAVRWLRSAHGVGRVLVVEWRGAPASAVPVLLAAEPAVAVLSVAQAEAGGATPASALQSRVGVPAGATGELYAGAFEAALDELLGRFAPEAIVLGAGFDALDGDPLSALRLTPADYHRLSAGLARRADEICAGRLVSVLEGGYATGALGAAVVQHLRALTGLPAA